MKRGKKDIKKEYRGKGRTGVKKAKPKVDLEYGPAQLSSSSKLNFGLQLYLTSSNFLEIPISQLLNIFAG